jgi:NAD(P)-dependent dehydrogenase (short-subunit alcohol dehydrogenase family)
MDLGLTEKVAWVTGGGGDIGGAIAAALAAEGADVAITGRTLDKLQATAMAITESTGRRVIAVAADVTDTDAVNAAAAQIVDQLGAIDILVNSAGQPGGKANGPLETVDAALLLNDIDEKLVSCLRTARAAVPHMKQRGWGRLIHVGGSNARRAGAYSAGARNIAMVHMSKTLSDELGEFGISSNVVHPGNTEGYWWDVRIARQANDRGVSEAEIRAEIGAGLTVGRMLTPQELAPVVAFLASPLSIGITGESIGIGGGTRGAVFL